MPEEPISFAEREIEVSAEIRQLKAKAGIRKIILGSAMVAVAATVSPVADSLATQYFSYQVSKIELKGQTKEAQLQAEIRELESSTDGNEVNREFLEGLAKEGRSKKLSERIKLAEYFRFLSNEVGEQTRWKAYLAHLEAENAKRVEAVTAARVNEANPKVDAAELAESRARAEFLQRSAGLSSVVPFDATSTELFFENYRKQFSNSKQTADVVANLEIIFREIVKDKSVTDIRITAYLLATIYHETDGTFSPLEEYGGEGHFHKMYDIEGDRPNVARNLGNTTPGDGVKFHGRGYIQLVGKRNYERAAEKLGVNLVDDPDLALRPDLAYRIISLTLIEGFLTNKKLSDFITEQTTDYAGARRAVVGGGGRAQLVAAYAEKFELILKDSLRTNTVVSGD
ncbi:MULTISPECIES: glycoside hydrolase family 19 protein [Paracoccaceae]|uniref:glycoside hydrolase family 19 protein n=1 Tax=Paracoccaceae TaxID=31989 RepID=UPI003299BA98